jgi:cell division protein FtsB
MLNFLVCAGTLFFFAWSFNRHKHSFWRTNKLIERAHTIDGEISCLTNTIAALEHKRQLLLTDSAYLEKVARNELYLSLTSDLLFSLKT